MPVGFCLLIAFGGLLVPVLVVRFPPLLDYPNHFARLWLTAGGADRPPLSDFYAVDWSNSATNIGPELVAATVGRLVGMDALGPMLLVAAVALPPLGAVLLNRAVFGGWHWWQVGFALLAWNATLMAGFLAFQIGLGLALLAAAADPALSRRLSFPVLTCLRVAIGAAIMVWHVFDGAFYAALLAGLGFGAALPSPGRRRAVLAAIGRALAAALPAFALPAAFLLFLVPHAPGQHAPPGVYDTLVAYDYRMKAETAASGFATYNILLDVLVILMLYAMGRLLSDRSHGRGHAGLALSALGLFALAMALPSKLGGTLVVDGRFPIMSLLTLVASVRPGFALPRQARLAALALMVMALLRSAWIGSIWHERQADLVAVQRAIAAVPPGAALLPAEWQFAPDAPLPRGRRTAIGLVSWIHLAAYAVPERQAYVPTLFSSPGKVPLRVRPPWNEVSVFEGGPVPLPFLTEFPDDPWWNYMVGYGRHWRDRFDYVLLLNADLPPAPGEEIPPELELVADEGFARLYRIRRAAP